MKNRYILKSRLINYIYQYGYTMENENLRNILLRDIFQVIDEMIDETEPDEDE